MKMILLFTAMQRPFSPLLDRPNPASYKNDKTYFEHLQHRPLTFVFFLHAISPYLWSKHRGEEYLIHLFYCFTTRYCHKERNFCPYSGDDCPYGRKYGNPSLFFTGYLWVCLRHSDIEKQA